MCPTYSFLCFASFLKNPLHPPTTAVIFASYPLLLLPPFFAVLLPLLFERCKIWRSLCSSRQRRSIPVDQVLQRMGSLWFQLSIRSTSPELYISSEIMYILAPPRFSQVLLVLKEHKGLGGGGKPSIGLEEREKGGGEDRGRVE